MSLRRALTITSGNWRGVPRVRDSRLRGQSHTIPKRSFAQQPDEVSHIHLRSTVAQPMPWLAPVTTTRGFVAITLPLPDLFTSLDGGSYWEAFTRGLQDQVNHEIRCCVHRGMVNVF
jgi:hypothetical protein